MFVELCLLAALALAAASGAGGDAADSYGAADGEDGVGYGPKPYHVYSVNGPNQYQPYGPRYYEQYTKPEPYGYSSYDTFDPYQGYYSTQLEKTLVEDSTPQSVAEFLPSCPDCAYSVDNRIGSDRQSSELAADALRLEAIKLQILTKLGLKSKPEIKKTMSRDIIMETLYRAGEGEMIEELSNEGSSTQGDHSQNFYHSGSGDGALDYDDFYGRTSEIITFAETGPTLNGQRLVEFPLPRDEPRPGGGPAGGLRVRTAYLWLKVDFRSSLPRRLQIKAADRNLTIWIFRVITNASRLSEKGFEEATKLVGSTSTRFGALGWLRVDVTEAAQQWSSGGEGPLRLLADCSGCGDMVRLRAGGGSRDEARPFLAVRAEAASVRRVRRRALDCAGAPRGHCCKQRFYVSFRALGWDDWIIAPRGYFANYCRGACGARAPDAFPSYHAHVIEEARRLDRLAGLQPCCAPVKFSAMSLIYFGPDSNIIKRDLPKMVVDECGCP